MKVDKFWVQVRKILREKNMTQKALAQACGFPYSTFRGWMKKNYFPTVIGGFMIARKLGVSVEYLVTGKERTGKKELEKVQNLLHRANEKLGRMPS